MDAAKQPNARAIKSGVVLHFIQRSGCAGLDWARVKFTLWTQTLLVGVRLVGKFEF